MMAVKKTVKKKAKAKPKAKAKVKPKKKQSAKGSAAKGAGAVKSVQPVSALDRDLALLESKISEFKEYVESPPKDIAPVDVEKHIRESSSVSVDTIPEDISEEMVEDVAEAEEVEEAEEKEMEKVVEKDLRTAEETFITELKPKKDLGALSFYFLTSLICTGLLAFLFGSVPTFVFYFLFGIFLWWWSHQFHKTGSRFIKSFLSLGCVVVVLYIFSWIFDDMLSTIVVIIYALSFVIGAVLYLYHTKKDLSEEIHRSFPRTFLVVFYSHIVAFTAAALLAYGLTFLVVADSFVSLMFLMLVWLLPTLIVYFLLTKFLYLRFFDRKHWARDLRKGVGHALIYSVVFILLLFLTYLLTAMQFVYMERDSYSGSFTGIFTDMQNVRTEIEAAPFRYDSAELTGMRVSHDVMVLADNIYSNATNTKTRLSVSSMSFWDYISDNYFTRLARDRMIVSSLAIYSDGTVELKEDLLREYERMRGETLLSADDASLQGYVNTLEAYIGENYVPYRDPYEFSSLREMIVGDEADAGSYEALIADGALLDFNSVYHEDAEYLFPGDDRFTRQFYDMMYHTVLFRDMMVLVFQSITFNVKETVDPYAVRHINIQPDEGLRSRVLRDRIIRSNVDAVNSLRD